MLTRHAIYKLAVLLVLCLGLLIRAHAQTESYIQTLAGILHPNDTCVVVDEKYADASLWSSIERNTKVQDIITFEVRFDTTIDFYKAPFSCELTANITFEDSSRQQHTIPNVHLALHYDTTYGKPYKGIAYYKFSGGHKVNVKIVSLTSAELDICQTAFLRIKSRIAIDRKYKVGAQTTSAPVHGTFKEAIKKTGTAPAKKNSPARNAISVSTPQLQLSWDDDPYNRQFDLEYTFYDANSDFVKNLPTTITDPEATLAPAFKNNATRVNPICNTYTLNVVYPLGMLFVRVRPYYFNDIGDRIEGDWIYTSGSNADPFIYQVTAEHQEGFTWQYNAVFAEEGKRKEIVSYFDGDGKSRQAVTIDNQNQVAIVQETILDKLNRPAVNVLPVPTDDNTFHYYPQFNLNAAGKTPYSYVDFNASLACGNEIAPMNNTSGASKYYSSKNAFLNAANPYYSQFARDIPDALNYPFSVTEYTNDPTGRIRKQGGVGQIFQPGGGRETSYYYGKPSQDELDRLFGSEVGAAVHYSKNMVIDPNGQVSVSYLDMAGKTVATALAGASPSNLKPLDATEEKIASSSINDEMIRPQSLVRDAENKNVSFNSTIMVPSTSAVPYKFTYEFTGRALQLIFGWNPQKTLCADCYYDVKFSISDECDNPIDLSVDGDSKTEVFVPAEFDYGNNMPMGDGTPDITCTTPPSRSKVIFASFPKAGEYKVHYELTMSSKALDFYMEYLKQAQVVKTENDFKKEYLQKLDLSGCFTDCKSCQQKLGTQTNFRERISRILQDEGIVLTTDGSDDAWIDALWVKANSACSAAVAKNCTVVDGCAEYRKMMLNDVSPGGQYMLYDENTLLFKENHVNIFNKAGGCRADGTNSPLVYVGTSETEVHLADLSDADIISNWKPEWGYLLLKYHPEFQLLQECEVTTNIANSTTQMKEVDDDAEALTKFGWYATPPGTYDLFDGYNYGLFIQNETNTILSYGSLSAPPFDPSGVKTEIEDKVNQFFHDIKVRNPDGSFNDHGDVSLRQFIKYSVYCPNKSPDYVDLGFTYGSGHPEICQKPLEEWRIFRNLYIAIKEAALRDKKTSTSTNAYIGVNALTALYNQRADPEHYPSISDFEIAVDGTDLIARYKRSTNGVNNRCDVHIYKAQTDPSGQVTAVEVGTPLKFDGNESGGDVSKVISSDPQAINDKDYYYVGEVLNNYNHSLDVAPNTSIYSNCPVFSASTDDMKDDADVDGNVAFHSDFGLTVMPNQIKIDYNRAELYPLLNSTKVCISWTNSPLQNLPGARLRHCETFDPLQTTKYITISDITGYSPNYTDHVHIYTSSPGGFPVSDFCIGNESSRISPEAWKWYFQKKRRFYQTSSSTDIQGFVTDNNGNITPPAANNYQQNCESLADGWMEKLKGCVYLPPSMETELRNRLIAVCVAGSDDTHPFGSSTVKPGTASAGYGDLSFAEAFSNSLVPKTAICNDLLLDFPLPFENQSILNDQGVNNLSSCGYSLLLKYQTEWIALGSAVYHTLPDYIKAKYDPNFYLTSSQIEELMTTYVSGCPLKRPMRIPGILTRCDDPMTPTCLDCDHLHALEDEFQSQNPTFTPDLANYYDLLAAFINRKYTMNISPSDLSAGFKKCLDDYSNSGTGNLIVQWTKSGTFGTAMEDPQSNIINVPDGYVFSSKTKGVQKISHSGNILWSNYSGYSVQQSVVADPVSGYVVIDSLGLKKLNAQTGAVLQTFSLPTASGNQLRFDGGFLSLQAVHDGYVATGVLTYRYSPSTSLGLCLVKFSTSGSSWFTPLDAVDQHNGMAAIEVPETGGGYKFVGILNDAGVSSGRSLVKFTAASSGITIAAKTMVDEHFNMISTYNNGYVLSTDDRSILVARYTADLTFNWQRPYSMADFGRPNSITATNDGGFLFAGISDRDAFIGKLNGIGDILWKKTTSTAGICQDYEGVYNMQETGNSGYITTGDDGVYTPITVVKYTGPGPILCTQPIVPQFVSDSNQCIKSSVSTAMSNADYAYKQYIDSFARDYRESYFARCLSITPSLVMEGQQEEYHYTLYYYDQAGNLVKTIPPKGVRLLTDDSGDPVNQYRLRDVGNLREMDNKECYKKAIAPTFRSSPPGGGVDKLQIAPTLYPLHNGGPLTLESWVKFNAATGSDQVIMDQFDDDGNGNKAGYYASIDASGKLHFNIFGRSTESWVRKQISWLYVDRLPKVTAHKYVPDPTPITRHRKFSAKCTTANFITDNGPLTDFYHVVFQYNGDTSDKTPVKIYVNGKLQILSWQTDYPSNDYVDGFHDEASDEVPAINKTIYEVISFSNPFTTASTTPLTIGAVNRTIDANPYTGFTGQVKQLRIYNAALPAPDIRRSCYDECFMPSEKDGLSLWMPLARETADHKTEDNVSDHLVDITADWGNPPMPQYPQHRLPTYYAYNTLNQVIRQVAPDAGESKMWYDRLGRLVASQNAEQKQSSLDPISGDPLDDDNLYSYTKYDDQGRIVEVGQKHNSDLSSTETSDPAALALWQSSGNNVQITQTIYDEPDPLITSNSDIILDQLANNNSRKRVVTSVYKDVEDPLNPYQFNFATHYIYDVSGNVRRIYQENKTANITKTLDYDFDLQSGKVNKLVYQKLQQDQYVYSYLYDAENRVSEAWSGRDQELLYQDAAYFYHLHGPLARMELGHQDRKVQGVDYAYTLQGWLKGINGLFLSSGSEREARFDLGNDGNNIPQDVYGYTLGYYDGDYTPIDDRGGAHPLTRMNFGFNTYPNTGQETGFQLFNGNIAYTTYANRVLSGIRLGENLTPNTYSYSYDQLNRLKEMRSHSAISRQGDDSWDYSTTIDDYKESVSYDANGNIKSYLRNGADNIGGLDMDDLQYHYKDEYTGGDATNNKLDNVVDAIGANGYTDDLKEGQTQGNYLYDKKGNVIYDAQAGINLIKWNVYGKIKSISKTDGTLIEYGYDPSGNRIMKTVTTPATEETGQSILTTYYFRDAQGNVLGVYEDHHDDNPLTWKEQHLYGSSRLGMWHPEITMDGTIPDPYDYTEVGSREYELTNHLGNVMATVSDKKIGSACFQPPGPITICPGELGVPIGRGGSTQYYSTEVLSATDYYPFGMTMPGREFTSGGTEYRYSINGQEKESELNKNITTAQYWDYDSRIGRRWNVDPKASSFPWQSPYSAMDDNPILKNDPDGSSGIVTIDKATKTVTVMSTITLYGEGASPALAKSTAQSIQNQWNDAHGTTNIKGVEYQVKFIVTPKYINVNEYGGLVGREYEKIINKNEDFSQNYIKVVTSGIPVSGMEPIAKGSQPGGNTGVWLLSNLTEKNSTTASHEWGHGWGELLASDGGNENGHPTKPDLRGSGQPGIMYPRGTLVDARFTKNPEMGNSRIENGSIINPMDPGKRKVTTADIKNLHLDKLNYDESGKANLGKLTNIYHP